MYERMQTSVLWNDAHTQLGGGPAPPAPGRWMRSLHHINNRPQTHSAYALLD